MSGALRTLPLADRHRALGARFAPFAGWAMPVQYTGIVEEHTAVRERAGVFDVSHMGRLYVSGPGAAPTLRRALTYAVGHLEPGQAHYALLCADDGGILDDVFVYRLAPERFLVVNNAANVETGRDRITSFATGEVAFDDRQASTAMLALQGPQAPAVAAKAGIGEQPERRRCLETAFAGETLFVSRTGYTGEDGFELVAPAKAAGELLDRLLDAGAAACGLGARDTLRLEAALPLYGNDIDATTNPYEAGLGFAVTLDDNEAFAGREALAIASASTPARTLACLRATGRGVMRAGQAVLIGESNVASIASGGFSPTLGTSIAMAYLPAAQSQEGTEVEVDVRGRRLPATVVRRPFYRRSRS